MGPNADSCGTPQLTFKEFDLEHPIFTHCVLLAK